MKPGDLVRYHPLLSTAGFGDEYDTEAVGIVTEIYSVTADRAGNSLKMARVLWPWGLVSHRTAALRPAEEEYEERRHRTWRPAYLELSGDEH